MAFIQVYLRWPAPPVKNWRILLVQSFTARMPLLTAHSHYGEDAGVLLNSVIYTVSVPNILNMYLNTPESLEHWSKFAVHLINFTES